MKNFITIISVFISSIVFSQNLDSLTFEYINIYRIKKGRQPLTWSGLLYKRCIKHSTEMVDRDSVYHSNIDEKRALGETFANGWRECVSFSKKSTIIKLEDYKYFIKKYYGFSYEEVLKDTVKYLAAKEVYDWSTSPSHNEAMLSNIKTGAVHVNIKSIKKHNNFVWGKEVFPGLGKFFYDVTSASTLQLQ